MSVRRFGATDTESIARFEAMLFHEPVGVTDGHWRQEDFMSNLPPSTGLQLTQIDPPVQAPEIDEAVSRAARRMTGEKFLILPSTRPSWFAQWQHSA